MEYLMRLINAMNDFRSFYVNRVKENRATLIRGTVLDSNNNQ